MSEISYQTIQEAYRQVKPHITQTPILTCEKLNKVCGMNLFFKAENMQIGGAFKYRGATNAVLQLSEDEASRGVCTHSSGNHALALALAAQKRGCSAYCVMPENSTQRKIDAVLAADAEIIFCPPTIRDRETVLLMVQSDTDAVFIHPYDNDNVINGQGTTLVEMLEQLDAMSVELDCVVAPIGGGGLMSGVSTVAAALHIKALGAEPELADDAYRSLKEGKLQPQPPIRTIAEGLRTSLSPKTFDIIRRNVAEIITVSEEEILEAFELLLSEVKTVVEVSGAVSLAAALKVKGRYENVGVIISGGNLDLSSLIDSIRQKTSIT